MSLVSSGLHQDAVRIVGDDGIDFQVDHSLDVFRLIYCPRNYLHAFFTAFFHDFKSKFLLAGDLSAREGNASVGFIVVYLVLKDLGNHLVRSHLLGRKSAEADANIVVGIIFCKFQIRPAALLGGLSNGVAQIATKDAGTDERERNAMKPIVHLNEHEILALTGKDTQEEGALALHAITGNIVIVTLGGKGCLCVNKEGEVLYAEGRKVKVADTIGAGDSAIAGFIAAAQKDLPPEECLKWASAYGTAACLTQGSQPPRAADIQGVLAKIQVQ